MKKIWKSIFVYMLCAVMFLQVGCGEQQSQESPDTDVISSEEGNSENAEYTYRDVLVDQSVIDGKFACYFFRSDHDLTQPHGETVSPGDCTLLIAPDGTTVMIDCNGMPVTARVVDYLQSMGIERIDHLIISHPDWDHYQGYPVLLRYMEIGCVYTSTSTAWTTEGQLANKFIKAVEEKGIPRKVLQEGDVMEFGGATAKVYWPRVGATYALTADDPGALNTNGGSLVIKVVYGESSFMFAGDLYVGQENVLVQQYGNELQADVEKMSHHGYSTSNGRNWIDTVHSKIAVAMCHNVGNQGVWNNYLLRGGVTMNTSLDGTCLIYTSGDGTYDVQVEKERDSSYFGALDTKDGHFRVE